MAVDVDGKQVERLRRYCAMQDRSVKAWRTKANDLGLNPEDVEKLQLVFVKDGFLDDNRFAESYVNAHIRDGRWGPIKLRRGLREQGISKGIVEDVLGRIEDSIWQENLQSLLDQRPQPQSENDRARLFRWLRGKGYPADVILQALDRGHARRTFAGHDHD
jgi:regulatory protein